MQDAALGLVKARVTTPFLLTRFINLILYVWKVFLQPIKHRGCRNESPRNLELANKKPELLPYLLTSWRRQEIRNRTQLLLKSYRRTAQETFSGVLLSGLGDVTSLAVHCFSVQTAPALTAVIKPTSAKGPRFLLTIQVLNLYNPLSPHKVIPHWIFFFFQELLSAGDIILFPALFVL